MEQVRNKVKEDSVFTTQIEYDPLLVPPFYQLINNCKNRFED